MYGQVTGRRRRRVVDEGARQQVGPRPHRHALTLLFEVFGYAGEEEAFTVSDQLGGQLGRGAQLGRESPGSPVPSFGITNLSVCHGSDNLP